MKPYLVNVQARGTYVSLYIYQLAETADEARAAVEVQFDALPANPHYVAGEVTQVTHSSLARLGG